MELKDKGYRIANHYNPLTGFVQMCVEKRYVDLLTGEEYYSVVAYVRNREHAEEVIRSRKPLW